jgi:hypothetical protein
MPGLKQASALSDLKLQCCLGGIFPLTRFLIEAWKKSPNDCLG